jgi:hypothetical protein
MILNVQTSIYKTGIDNTLKLWDLDFLFSLKYLSLCLRKYTESPKLFNITTATLIVTIISVRIFTFFKHYIIINAITGITNLTFLGGWNRPYLVRSQKQGPWVSKQIRILYPNRFTCPRLWLGPLYTMHLCFSRFYFFLILDMRNFSN